eukprot:GHVR01184875.1.p1 GENE.GHVR01184875.1~~GHVR01184875.1.p1  ORF type:complete len:609 (+),score=139.43 GHVR01184875.1:31-1857(+)
MKVHWISVLLAQLSLCDNNSLYINYNDYNDSAMNTASMVGLFTNDINILHSTIIIPGGLSYDPSLLGGYDNKEYRGSIDLDDILGKITFEYKMDNDEIFKLQEALRLKTQQDEEKQLQKIIEEKKRKKEEELKKKQKILEEAEAELQKQKENVHKHEKQVHDLDLQIEGIDTQINEINKELDEKKVQLEVLEKRLKEAKENQKTGVQNEDEISRMRDQIEEVNTSIQALKDQIETKRKKKVSFDENKKEEEEQLYEEVEDLHTKEHTVVTTAGVAESQEEQTEEAIEGNLPILAYKYPIVFNHKMNFVLSTKDSNAHCTYNVTFNSKPTLTAINQCAVALLYITKRNNNSIEKIEKIKNDNTYRIKLRSSLFILSENDMKYINEDNNNNNKNNYFKTLAKYWAAPLYRQQDTLDRNNRVIEIHLYCQQEHTLVVGTRTAYRCFMSKTKMINTETDTLSTLPYLWWYEITPGHHVFYLSLHTINGNFCDIKDVQKATHTKKLVETNRDQLLQKYKENDKNATKLLPSDFLKFENLKISAKPYVINLFYLTKDMLDYVLEKEDIYKYAYFSKTVINNYQSSLLEQNYESFIPSIDAQECLKTFRSHNTRP